MFLSCSRRRYLLHEGLSAKDITMTDNAQHPFHYSVQTEDATIHVGFSYIVDQGKTIVSLFGIWYLPPDGPWREVPFGQTGHDEHPYGKEGSQIVLHGMPYSPDPSMGSTDYTLALAFNAAIDFTKPLPVDQLTTEGSGYTIHSWSILNVDENKTYAIKAVIPIP